MAIQGGSGGRSASDVRAGGAFYELYAKDGLSRVIDKLKMKVEHFASSMRKIGGTLFGAGLAAAATPLASLMEGVSRASEIHKLAETFGITAEEASKMAYAFEIAGDGIEALHPALAKLAAANTTGKPLDEFFQDVAEQLSKISDASERFQAASEIFGPKFASRFIDVTGEVDGLKKLMEQAPLTSAAQALAAEKIERAWRDVGITFKTAMLPVFEYLAPIAKMVAEFARANSGLLIVVGAVGVGLITLGAIFFTLGTVISGLVTIWTGLLAILSAATAPLGVIALAIGGLLALAVDWQKVWRDVGATFYQTIKGMGDAIKSGDLELAFNILSQGVRAIWFRMLDDMLKGLDDFIERNRTKLIALGALLGAKEGLMAGLRFGPKGALLGAAGGAIVGGGAAFGAGEIAQNIARNAGFDAKAAAAEARLAALVAQAARQAAQIPARPEGGPGLFKGAEAVKGGFNPNSAMQQFAYGNEVKKQSDILNNILGELRAQPGKIGAAVGDELKLK